MQPPDNFDFNKCPTRCDLFSLLHFCGQELIHVYRTVGSSNSTTRADGSRSGQSIPEAVITVVPAPDDGVNTRNI